MKGMMMNDLAFDVLCKRRESATQGIPPGKEDLAWVSNSATLIFGQRDAILIDCFLAREQTEALADWVSAHDRRLTTIYLTHAHPDHFFGLKALQERFPHARAVAAPQVVDAMVRNVSPEMVAQNWARRWPGQIPEELSVAVPLTATSMELEGHELRVVDTGHTDTDATTALHAPSIDLIIAADAVYNGTHAFLVESDADGRREWIAAIDRLIDLAPTKVVVGHGPLEPDNSPGHMERTKRYILDFEEIEATSDTALQLYQSMLALYPDHINPGSLWGSAHATKRFAATQV